MTPRDKDQELAIEAGRALVGRLVTTDCVLFEVGDAMPRPSGWPRFARLLESLSAQANVEIVSASASLLSEDVKLFRERPDKERSLTDCLSFFVMNERDIEEALTADEDFQQADFQTSCRPIALDHRYRTRILPACLPACLTVFEPIFANHQ